jgi:hypothetical protein
MTTPSGQEPRPGPPRGGPARPAPRGADPGWPGNGGDARRRGPGRVPGAPGAPGVPGNPGAAARDGADPRRDAYGTGRPPPGTGRPDPDPRRQRRNDPGAAGRGWGRGAEAAPGGAGAPRRNQPGAPGGLDDGFRAGQRRTGRTPGVPGDQFRSQRPPAFRWLGALSTRAAVYILLAATLLGVIGTVVTGREPGFWLGFCTVVGSVIAAVGIRRGRLYVLIPLPALVLFFGAAVTGAFHDRNVDTSTTEIGVNFLQWIANVFFAMCAATILVLVIAGGRWLLSRQLVAGQFPMSGGGAGSGARPRPGPSPRSAGTGPGREPLDEQGGGTRWNGRGLGPTRDQRGGPGVPPNRRGTGDQRDNGDRWGSNGRGDRPSWTPRDQRDSRNPRDDRRPTY